MEWIKGQEINDIRTIGSMYDQNCIRVWVGKEEYRMPTTTIIQMVNEFVFRAEKKRIYKWLVEAVPLQE